MDRPLPPWRYNREPPPPPFARGLQYPDGWDMRMTPYLPNSRPDRPWVTLTYAQSLDSMISLGPGLRTTLSGPESKSLTHFLRFHHDAILIGGGTAVADDPSLNCRDPNAKTISQPRPVIVGSNISQQWLDKCKATSLAAKGQAYGPWIVKGVSRAENLHAFEWVTDHCLEVDTDPDNGRIDWDIILAALYRRGIESVMIEGGATIINDLLQRPEIVDSVIITIAPRFLGKEGVQVSPNATITDGQRSESGSLRETFWGRFGEDVVLFGKLQH